MLETTMKVPWKHILADLWLDTQVYILLLERVQRALSILEDWGKIITLIFSFRLGADVFNIWALTLCLSTGLDSYIMFKKW